ncbi:S8 family peptidase [Deinococcus maricopensis]|uniref:Peptidase S8 and S53 subtilisin kexin sedolisin n=1 Tax=Deinococcus maricopensis (strain DSM 21211 / LMG 22137 / NRRL B-23946 / LB-34) TaxID=709986 RepID=E8U7U7_DEIML|nr:S8 family peptidase [Deinococcus maricopensis]ADV67136.1 peptidase S8 and S53 subtilisin kexin sedolisin [Deinococcus maricopensis DSM 21211]
MPKFPKSASRPLALAVTLSVLLAACSQPQGATPTSALPADDLGLWAAPANVPADVPGELIVKVRARTPLNAQTLGLGALLLRAERLTPGGDVYRLTVPSGREAQALHTLSARGTVAYAERNHTYTPQGAYIVNDTFYSTLWGLQGSTTQPASPYGTGAAAAWARGYTGSASVYVGVVDTGVQIDHPDLAAQVWTNPADPADGVDNDGNGYVDDTRGWNFTDGSSALYTGNADKHGTHVAGIIGARANNAQGVAGVNWAVNLIPTKFLGTSGYGDTANAVSAIAYLTDLKVNRGVNVVAINSSWSGAPSQALYDAISAANDAGILFVASAGNNGVNADAQPAYPAAYDLPNVVSVTAIDKAGALPSWANTGAGSVDLGAPGVSIRSTVNGSTYATADGTSMATAFVTGAAALYASTHPGVSPSALKAALLASVTPTASLQGRTVTGGRLDVARLMTLP